MGVNWERASAAVDNAYAMLRRMRGYGTAGAIVAAVAALAGCGGGGSNTSASSSGAGGGSASGPVKVLYAGSLTGLMEHTLGPAFTKATGDQVQGYAAGSTELAQQIKGKVRQGDVFISASPDADAAAGDLAPWYATFATSPVVIGYNPKSRYAADFKSKPWYQVIAEPGIRVGRTDPKLDPKGEKTVAAVDAAAGKLHRPQLERALAKFPVYPEETLVGRLQAGQLDAAFFYSIESTELKIPTVGLEPADESATYTVTVLRSAPHEKGAEAFVRYLLGPRGTAMLHDAGFELVTPPSPSGDRAAIPSSLRSAVGTR